MLSHPQRIDDLRRKICDIIPLDANDIYFLIHLATPEEQRRIYQLYNEMLAALKEIIELP